MKITAFTQDHIEFQFYRQEGKNIVIDIETQTLEYHPINNESKCCKLKSIICVIIGIVASVFIIHFGKKL